MPFPPSARLFFSALNLARVEHGDAWEQWTKLLQAGHPELVFAYSDAITDICLRSLETEAKVVFAPGYDGSSTCDLGVLVSLSKAFVFTWYETIRCIQQRLPRDHVQFAEVTELRRKFELVRVPLAKQRIANDGKINEPWTLRRVGPGLNFLETQYSHKNPAPYMPIYLWRTDTGSLAWEVIDAKRKRMVQIARRELADDILSLWGQGKPS